MAPPVRTKDPAIAQGDRLIATGDLPPGGVAEVEHAEHGTLAVGIADGRPFAVSNVCRHQFAKLGRGRVTEDGCLECPWHRARFDPATGQMTSGPKGRVFGFKPYSAAVKSFSEVAPLKRLDVEVREDAIWLAAG